MSKKTSPQALGKPKTCTVKGCKAPLHKGCGCTGPKCSNYFERWPGGKLAPKAPIRYRFEAVDKAMERHANKKPTPIAPPEDDRAALLAALAARRKKAKK